MCFLKHWVSMLALIVAAVFSAQAQTLVLDPIADNTTVTGSGAPANGPVELFRNGVSLGSVQADGAGNFAFTGVQRSAGDAFVASVSQVWNFNADGDTSGWWTDGSGVVEGGLFKITETGGDASLTFNIYNDTIVDGDITRVLEIRARYLGAGSPLAALQIGTAGGDGVAGGADDTVGFGKINQPFPSAGSSFQTHCFDLSVDSFGADSLWQSAEKKVVLGIVINNAGGVADGDVIEIDYIRLTEYFDWDFKIDGETMEWAAGNGASALNVAGGTMNYSNTSAGVKAFINYKFEVIDSDYFNTLKTRVDRDTGQANQLEYFYWLDTGGFADSDQAEVNYTDGAGFEENTIDLTTVAGADWGQDPTTLNNPAGTYSSHFPPAISEATSIDYIRLCPATVYGPSATVTASQDVGGATYYISSSTGDDNAAGTTAETAWASFTPIASVTLGPGESVLLKRGDTWPNSQLVLTGKGTVGSPIMLSAYGEGPNPRITGLNLTDAACIILNNASNFNVDSMDCRDAKVGLYLRYTGGNTDGTGAMFNNENIQVTCSNFQNMDQEWSDVNGDIAVVAPYELSWGSGIWIGGSIPAPPGGPWPAESTTILDGLTIKHCSFPDCSTGVGTNWYFPSVVYKSRVMNVIIEDSWVSGCENGSVAFSYVDGGHARRFDAYDGGQGFYRLGTTAGFIQSSQNYTIDDCEFAFNDRNATGNDGSGFDFEGDCDNMIFTNNVLHNNDGCGLLILDSPPPSNNTNLVMENNTFWNNCRNPKSDSSSQNNELRYPNDGSTGSFANNGVYLGSDQGVGGLDIYDNPSNWNDFTPSGNRTGTDWASVSGRPTQWGFNSSVEGWGSENEWTGLAASGGTLVGTSAGTDPYIYSAATWVNTRQARWVKVTMSQTAGATAQVFFVTETDGSYDGTKSVAFPIIADGTMHDYIVDMGTSSAYKGVVTGWRLDPTDASGSTMVIDAFESHVEPYMLAAAAVTASSVDVQFNQPMGLDGGVLDPANYVISGVGQGTLAATPDAVSQICTANGPVYRLSWDSGGTDGNDAVITVSNALDSRGVAVLPGTLLAFTTIEDIEPVTYTLTYTAGDNGSLTGVTTQVVEEGSDGTAVTAVPDSGYVFALWTDGVTDNPRTDINVQDDLTVEARFARPDNSVLHWSFFE